MGADKNGTYKKFEVDNAVCGRRFHISYEVGNTPQKHVEVKCPHCGVKLYEADNHPEVILAREENLVKSPDGTNPIVYECRFNS